jgi:hypothetical protein
MRGGTMRKIILLLALTTIVLIVVGSISGFYFISRQGITHPFRLKYVKSVQMTYKFSFANISSLNFTALTRRLVSLGYSGQSHLDDPPPPPTQTYQYYLCYGKSANDSRFDGGILLEIGARNDTFATIFNFSHGFNPFRATNENITYEKSYLENKLNEFNHIGNLNVPLDSVNWYFEYTDTD